MPLVSVIIPTYNRAALLRETIDSVLAQTCSDLECIVVDDGSSDETPRLLMDYAKRYPGKLIPIRQGNRGGTAARNTGAAAARGAFLNFLDHDDLLMPEKIAKQMKVFEKRRELGLVHCGFYQIDKEGSVIGKVNYLPDGDVLTRLVQGCFLWSGAPLIRRECFRRVGFFSEAAWSSDAEMWLRISMAGYRFGCVHELLGSYRILPDSSMADVSRTEHMDLPTLDRVFSDPRLPSEARKLKKQAYFNERYWLAFRYYAVAQWEDGHRNLREALRFKPDLRRRGSPEFLQLLLGSFLDTRVSDPVAFSREVFEHLPPEVRSAVEPGRNFLMSWIHAGEALRHFGRGKLYEGTERFAEAVRLNPSITTESEEFATAVTSFAFHVPGSPLRFVTTVMRNLPPEARTLIALRRRLQASVIGRMLILEIRFGTWSRLPGLLLEALRHYPLWACNPEITGRILRRVRSLFAIPGISKPFPSSGPNPL